LSAFISEALSFEKESDQKVTLLVGNDEWPFPVSIIRSGRSVRFDTDNGVEEVHAGASVETKIDATLACRAYALAQYDYFNNEIGTKDRYRNTP
jgi:hypothetical protein